jgi:hypothetical protein
MAINQAWCHKLTVAVDFMVARRGAVRRIDFFVGRSDDFQFSDPATFDNNIDWTGRRGARTVNDRRTAQDQSLKRARTSVAARCGGRRAHPFWFKHLSDFFADLSVPHYVRIGHI